MSEPYCALALLKAAAYACVVLIARSSHGKVWLGYIPIALLEVAKAALLAGVLVGRQLGLAQIWLPGLASTFNALSSDCLTDQAGGHRLPFLDGLLTAGLCLQSSLGPHPVVSQTMGRRSSSSLDDSVT
jgi:hypothetical protein